MSDELTFLRWCYQNAYRFIRETNWIAYDRMAAAYTAETGNGVPGDYRGVILK